MEKLNPPSKTVEMAEEILSVCEEKGLTMEEVENLPAELQRKINRKISEVKKTTKFTYLQ